MRKWTVPIVLLITVALLISFAFLPALSGALQDAGVEKTVFQRPVHSIAPYISENGTALSFLDKLRIFQKSEFSAFVPALASVDEQRVRAAVEAGVQPYAEAGVACGFEGWEFHAVPYVAISLQDAARGILFWDVGLVEAGDDRMRSLNVIVDDETGKFLALHYYDPNISPDWQLWDEKCLPLSRFSEIWLEQAGLRDSAWQITPAPESQQIQGVNPGMRTEVYGLDSGAESLLCVTFALSDAGEYTMWLESMPQ